MSNAVKFTPEKKEIKLSARLLEERHGICKLEVSVADYGIGISDEQQKRLFNLFTQAESSTARKFGGSGLGLAISKHIVELMGGRLWVESVLGEGATFTFTIELGRGKDDVEPEEAQSKIIEEKNIFKGYRLLLAEDLEINREIVTVMLESTGIEIEYAVNGREAVTMVEAAPEKYNMIFMDVQMPEIDGLEATRLIRKLPSEKAKNIPVVAMSANVFREDIEKCMEAGMNNHVGKPLDFLEVFDIIKKYTVDKK